MQAMKDVAVLSAALGASPLAKSPIWSTPLTKVHPAQFLAFRHKMKEQGLKDQADAAIDYAISRLGHMVDEGILPDLPLLDYSEPERSVMTGEELVSGLSMMTRPMSAIVLFAMETGMQPDQIVTLTRQAVRKMPLTPRAAEIVQAQPLSLTTKFVFWRDYSGRHMPAFGFDQELFDAFGQVWAELKPRLNNLVWLS